MYTPEEIEVLKEIQEDEAAETTEDNFLGHKAMEEAYGEAEERKNQHSFLHKAAFESQDTIKTTFLHPEELGRPLFSIRFLLDMEDVAKHYLDSLSKHYKKYGTENKIADYFYNKALNISDSGMSNEGFAMSLNVTKKMDMQRRKISDSSMQNLKGKRRRR